MIELPRPRVPLAAVQGTLALELQPRTEPPVLLPQPAPSGPPPEDRLTSWAGRFAQAAVEIVGGDRPVAQLVRWTDQRVYQDLSRRAQLVARAGRHHAGQSRVQPVRPKVVGVHVTAVVEGVVEACFRVRYGARSRAIAGRFEWRTERWLCTALEFS
ncbi:MAG: Rv3235 family protein [Nocardioides sp.]|uniref:Rv3235 family protein n=1 Tax=Nocardioides sp. TaxID=35761 RepID=UPI0039E48151